MSDTYTYLINHFIFSTKNREPLIPDALRPRLHAYIGGILRENNCALHDAGGIEDHMHILARRHPTVSEAEVMRLVKTNASKWIHETFREMAAFAWQRGYAAFTVSFSGENAVRTYIANQRQHHNGTTYIDELKEYLEKHEMPYDPRYLE